MFYTLCKHNQIVSFCQKMQADCPSTLTFTHTIKMAAGHGDKREMYLFWRTAMKRNIKVLQQNILLPCLQSSPLSWCSKWEGETQQFQYNSA